jgi:2-methylcitrate dehydratase PrpD
MQKENKLMSHWAIPCNIWKTMQEEKEAKDKGQLTKKQQQHLSDFKTVTGPCEFTRQAALQAVMKLIATNNQVSHLWMFYSEK